jgi:hypothetical protein
MLIIIIIIKAIHNVREDPCSPGLFCWPMVPAWFDSTTVSMNTICAVIRGVKQKKHRSLQLDRA